MDGANKGLALFWWFLSLPLLQFSVSALTLQCLHFSFHEYVLLHYCKYTFRPGQQFSKYAS